MQVDDRVLDRSSIFARIFIDRTEGWEGARVTLYSLFMINNRNWWHIKTFATKRGMQLICIVENIIRKNCVRNCDRLSFAGFQFTKVYVIENVFLCSNDTVFPRADTREIWCREEWLWTHRVISYVIEKIHRQWPHYGSRRFLVTTFRVRPDLALHFFF